MQLVLEVDELLHLALHHLGHGDAGPGGHHLGDFLLRHLLLENRAVLLLVVQGLFCLLQLALQLGDAAVADLGGLHQIAFAGCALLFGLRGFEVGFKRLDVFDDVLFVLPFGLALRQCVLSIGDFLAQMLKAFAADLVRLLHKRLLLDLHLGELALRQIDLFGHAVDLDAQTAGCLVHEVDGLVGQETIGDVAVRQLRAGDDGGIGDAHAMMDLVLLLQAAKDGDGVLDRGLADHDRLKTTLKSGILFDVLAILIERGCADGMQLATRQGWLEHVARIHGAIARGTGADDGVQLVDEQDNLAVRLLDLAQNRLQAVLELAAVLSACDHGAQIERDDVVVLQAGRDIAGDDALRQAFDDGGFADAGFADKHGVVLRAAAEHLDGAANLLGTADDRVELALARLLRKVLTVLVQGVELRLALLIGDAGGTAQGAVRLLNSFPRDAEAVEHTAGVALVLSQGDKQVLGGCVAVAHALGRLHGVVDDLHKVVAGHGHRHGGAAGLRHGGDGGVDVLRQLRRIGADALDDGGQIVLRCVQHGLEQVNGLDGAGLRIAGNAHRSLEGLLSGNGKFI